MRLAFYVLLLAVVVPGPACAQTRVVSGMPLVVRTAPDEQPAEAGLEGLAQLFQDGALRDELKRVHPLARWTHPVNVTLRGDAAARWFPAAQAIAADLEAATGLAITVYEQPFWSGDIDVVVTNVRGYWPPMVSLANGRRDEPFTCIALPMVSDGEIRGSRIIINAAVVGPDNAEACLAEELYQSMGMFGEVDDHPDGTLLNDDVGYRRIGPIDRLLLSVLYDRRLTPDMDAEAAGAAARRILAERMEE
ncbi:DUF2927 domain-containing protein [Azospirillum canadense]|uniref:DUF2927 domain-containing protein n=1 Tax=Azospirillum canadense TaxID=403962 RepID=UPI00222767F5|nr:DUF2927 domain-containing protein [Azospirillum canadense]MCW2236058.1 hypothetical protein [Azospirillum canadense]